MDGEIFAICRKNSGNFVRVLNFEGFFEFLHFVRNFIYSVFLNMRTLIFVGLSEKAFVSSGTVCIICL